MSAPETAIGEGVGTETIEAVSNLLVRYMHCLDDGSIGEWPDLFMIDGTYQITTRENVAAGYPLGIVLCEGRGMMDDRVKALNDANIFEAHTYCHIGGRPEMHRAGDGAIVCRTNFTVHRTMYSGEVTLFAAGKYLDRIVASEGRLRFQERRVVLDSRRIDTLLVYPL
jgi:anthranilate 1,2-dioxygenase small subunit